MALKINFNYFTHLRLSTYIPAEDVEEVDAFEYMGHLWSGEIVVFTQVLQPRKEPDVTRAVLIDLEDSQMTDLGEMILAEIGIPLKKGMTLEEIGVIVERAPFKTNSFSKDRKEYEYLQGDGNNLLISCVVHEHAGLIYVSILMGEEYING